MFPQFSSISVTRIGDEGVTSYYSFSDIPRIGLRSNINIHKFVQVYCLEKKPRRKIPSTQIQSARQYHACFKLSSDTSLPVLTEARTNSPHIFTPAGLSKDLEWNLAFFFPPSA